MTTGSESEREEIGMDGDGGDGIDGERDGDWPRFGFRRNTLDEEVARIRWEAWRIEEWHVIV